jgi:hypothetical protein
MTTVKVGRAVCLLVLDHAARTELKVMSCATSTEQHDFRHVKLGEPRVSNELLTLLLRIEACPVGLGTVLTDQLIHVDQELVGDVDPTLRENGHVHELRSSLRSFEPKPLHEDVFGLQAIHIDDPGESVANQLVWKRLRSHG